MDKAKKNYGRYVTVNLCNYHTIEFRLFRGTLKYNTLIATLELVNKICELAVLMDDDEIAKLSWSEFVAGINEPELIQYLKARQLYINEKITSEEEMFGWLDYKHIVPYKVLKKLTQALANAAEERGTDAAGISYIRDGKIVIFKRPKPSHKIHFNASDGTTAIMGHTRLTTQGNQKFNQNNHPFPGHADKSFSFAHNGVLHNDVELRKTRNLSKTNIETDSFVAVQLIEQQKKLDFNSLKNMAETVQGNFTFTVLDEDNSLYIIKGNNPMCLLHFEMLGIYIYAST